MASSRSAVSGEESLLRTNYAPEHIENGIIIPAAISSKDLTDRGFSVDREKLVLNTVLEKRIENQKKRQPNLRMSTHISIFPCCEVSDTVLSSDKLAAFKVEKDPVAGNIAHAAILSAVPRTRSQIKALKALLLPVLQKDLKPFENFLETREKSLSIDGIAKRAGIKLANFFSSLKRQ